VRVRPRLAIFVAVVALLASASPAARGTLPYPPRSGDPSDYSRLHIRNGACMPLGRGEATPPGSDLPKGFDCRTTTKLTDYRAQPGDPDYDPLVASNPQELFGQKGSGTNRAWEVTTGRPDTVIAIMDSGILWSTPALAKKVALNWRELPVPCPATPCSAARARSARSVDVDHDGLVTVADYEQDARVRPANGTFVTGQDLIRTFSDGRDDDGNGYVDDIAGWDFYQADNDPSDDVTYGHGTGEAKDSSAEIELEMTQCPNCRFLPLRVGDSFIADINHWAEAVVYAVDNRASVVQEALGTLNHTSFGQIAADYAYRHGVLIVASEADESAGHHNYPAALNHTMVVNSLTHYLEQGGVALERPLTYLAFNGCTNFGGYTWVSVPSNSCSSDATGQSSGMAGLLYSAAQNAVEKGVIKPDRSGKPLSAEEAKQLFRAAAQDIDFATPQGSGPPNNVATTLPASQRFATTPRWDQITGWGRINADRLVRFVAAGHIPPEADIAAPRWWQSLGTTGKVKLTGRVAAPRARSYRYEVQFAPGVQAPPWPSSDRWTTVASGRGTKAREGKLATLDLARIRAAIDAAPSVYTPLDDPTSPDLPEKDAFRVRVVVHTDRPGVPDAVEQRQFFSTHDPDLLPGFPRLLGSVAADGAGSPAFADIDGDGANELVVPDGDGRVHAFKPDGTEARGWPVRTGRIRLPTTGDNGYTTAAELASDVRAPLLLGSPAVADLDGDGKPEVAAADTEGYLYVWHHDGHMARGFPVSVNRAYSEVPGCQTAIGPACDEFVAHPVRDHVNTVDHAFAAQPAVGNLDPRYPGLELVAGAMDGHVYAFHADGTPVPGWPVLLRDPAKVAAVDAVSHRITFKPAAAAKYGRQVITTPSLADVTGDGVPEVAVNVDEEYDETPNLSLRDSELLALHQVAPGGNTRVYLLHPDGSRHPRDPGAPVIANLPNNAYVKGWPVPIAMVQTELLPDVGSGSDGAPTFADVDGDGRPEVATASIGSPPYLLNADGTSFYGADPSGKYVTMASSAAEFKSRATDGPSVASLGGGVFGRLGGDASPLAWAMGATGLRRLLDVVLPEQQLGAEDHLGAWDASTGSFLPGFPARMNDLMFFATPAIADVNGDGRAEVLQGSAMYDVRAYGLGGGSPVGWPKFTGGWSVVTPAVGRFGKTSELAVALITREGNLFVWRTTAPACSAREWPKYQHDLLNSGNYAGPGRATADRTCARARS
jgi:hypothetical protein